MKPHTPNNAQSISSLSPASSPALSSAWAGQLAQSLQTTSALSPEAQARLKHNILNAIAQTKPSTADTATPALRNVRRDEGWKPLAARVEVKLLHDDGHTLSWLLKLQPGGRLLAHDHADGAEECMVLEGSLCINGESFAAGDYQIAEPGTVHHEVMSDAGCLVYLRSPSSRRKDLML
jgi:quercetin dioxygenase-like cupin family protein